MPRESFGLIAPLAWRNLWRNRLCTWLAISVMARNLGAKLGDELMVLGSRLDGGVAFGLGDQAHIVLARVTDFENVQGVVPLIRSAVAPAVLGGALIAFVGHIGIPLHVMVGGMLRRYHMPDRIYPRLDVATPVLAPVLMLLATQLAAAIPAWRIRTLKPVEALRVAA